MEWPYVGGGLALLALGALIFVSQDAVGMSATIYAILHSIWHILSAVGQTLLIEARLPSDVGLRPSFRSQPAEAFDQRLHQTKHSISLFSIPRYTSD